MEVLSGFFKGYDKTILCVNFIFIFISVICQYGKSFLFENNFCDAACKSVLVLNFVN